jgi:hypothetical protein
MFVSGHRESSVLGRFSYDASNDRWVAGETFDAEESLGAVIVVP